MNMDEMKTKDLVPDSCKESIPHKNRKQWVMIGSITAIVILALIGALSVRKIILGNKLHQVYQIEDQGIIAAIEEDFMQKIDISDEGNGFKFTVDHIIVDEKRLVVLYTIRSKKRKGILEDMFYQLYNEEGKRVNISMTYPMYNMDLSKKRLYKGHLSFVFTNEEMPEEITIDFNLKLEGDDRREYSSDMTREEFDYHVTIPIEHRPFDDKKIVYELNTSFLVDGQRIFVDDMIIYPLMSVVHIRYDDANTKKIFDIEGFKIIENGHGYVTGVGGLTSSGGDQERWLYYESNYFNTKHRDIALVGNGITALEKNQLEVVVDIANKKILRGPDEDMTVLEVTDRYVSIGYSVDGLLFDTRYSDGSGQVIETNQQGFSARDDIYETLVYFPEGEEIVSPLTLKISRYPVVIEDPFEVNILK